MSSSSSRTEQRQETIFTDNRAVLGEGALQATTGSTINQWVLDGGAINRAFDFGLNALTFTAKQNAAVLDTLQDTQQLTADAFRDAKGRGALTDKMMIFAIGSMAVVAAVVAMQKG